MDRHLSSVGKGQVQDHARAGVGDGDTDEASGDAEERAFYEQLADQNGAGSSKSGSNRSLGETGCAPGQGEFRGVGARYQEKEI